MDLECRLIGRSSSQSSSDKMSLLGVAPSFKLLKLLLLLILTLLLFMSVVSVDWLLPLFETCFKVIVCLECSCSFSWKKRALYCISTFLAKLGEIGDEEEEEEAVVEVVVAAGLDIDELVCLLFVAQPLAVAMAAKCGL